MAGGAEFSADHSAERCLGRRHPDFISFPPRNRHAGGFDLIPIQVLVLVGVCHERLAGSRQGAKKELSRADSSVEGARFCSCTQSGDRVRNTSSRTCVRSSGSKLTFQSDHSMGASQTRLGMLSRYIDSSRTVSTFGRGGRFRGQYRYGQLLIDRGLLDEAVPLLAVDNTPIQMCIDIAVALLEHPEPRLRELDARAQADLRYKMIVP